MNKKAINDAKNVVQETFDGFLATYGKYFHQLEGVTAVAKNKMDPDKVGLVIGGGSGHEPLHTGFVGHGMLNAACPGQVFTSPTPDHMLAAAEAADTGSGRAVHREELRGRRHEFPHGARDVGKDGRNCYHR